MKFFQNENLFSNNLRKTSTLSHKTTLDRHKSWYGPVTNRFWDFSFFHWKKSVRNNIRILSRVGPPNFGNKEHTKKIKKIFFQTWNLPRWVSFQDVRTKKNLTNYLTDPHVIHRLTVDFWKKKFQNCTYQFGMDFSWNKMNLEWISLDWRLFHFGFEKVTRGSSNDVWVFQTSLVLCFGHFQSFTLSLEFF